jgi:hypothetical protein
MWSWGTIRRLLNFFELLQLLCTKVKLQIEIEVIFSLFFVVYSLAPVVLVWISVGCILDILNRDEGIKINV